MSQTKPSNPQETLDQIKQAITVDDEGMFIMLGKRIIITPQETLGNLMCSAADLGGINLAKVFMRKAGYDIGMSMSKIMIDVLKLAGNDLVTFYADTAGKRGWGFNVIEQIDGANGVFRCVLHHSPFVLGFKKKTATCVCDFQAGALEAMFHAAGFKDMQIVETQCVAKGDDSCVFENTGK
jgi:predicted hydrocarbon binding protein